MAAPLTHRFVTKPVAAKGSQTDDQVVRNQASFPTEVTLADDATYVVSTISSPGLYFIQQKAATTEARGGLFMVSVHATTGAPNVTELATIPDADFSASDTDGDICFYLSSTTGLTLKNRLGATATFYNFRVC